MYMKCDICMIYIMYYTSKYMSILIRKPIIYELCPQLISTWHYICYLKHPPSDLLLCKVAPSGFFLLTLLCFALVPSNLSYVYHLSVIYLISTWCKINIYDKNTQTYIYTYVHIHFKILFSDQSF